MTLSELLAYAESTFRDCVSLLARKNKDYSHYENTHSNFEEVSAICKILNVDISKPRGVIEYHIAQKVHRLFKLINTNHEPTNESLADSAKDLIDYIILLTTWKGNV
jgi:hypothetical protein